MTSKEGLNNMEEIKDRLKKALEIRQLKPAELARKSGIDKGSLSRYLKGDYLPKQTKIGAMAEALKVSPTWLLGYDVTMDGELLPSEIQLDKLTEENRTRILAYYQALIDSQEVK